MILVTGGTGLIGSHLLYQLSIEHDDITAIYRKSSDLKKVKHIFSYYSDDFELCFNNIKWIEADITDVNSLIDVFKGVQYVYHCAALVSFDESDYQRMKKSNIEGTANIANLCISNKVKKICYVSSVAAIGKSIDDEDINENNEWNIEQSNYGYAITKHGAEMEMWRASQEGVNVVIVNPGIVLGSGFWSNGSGKLFSSVYRGLKFYTEGITGFVGVADVVKIMISLMHSTVYNERFILVSENISYKDVLFKIADCLHKKRPSIRVTKTMSGIFWKIEWCLKLFGRKPYLTRHSSKSSHRKNYYSNKKIKEALDYEFEAINTVVENVCTDFMKDHS